MSIWLIKEDLLVSLKYFLILFSIITIQIVAADILIIMADYLELKAFDTIIVILYIVLGIFITLIVSVGVFFVGYNLIKKDYKKRNYLYFNIKNFGIYYIYKIILSIAVVFATLTAAYFVGMYFSLIVSILFYGGGYSSEGDTLFYIIGAIFNVYCIFSRAFFICILGLLNVGYIILFTIIIAKYSKVLYALGYGFFYLLLAIILMSFSDFNLWILYYIRSILFLALLIYTAGYIVGNRLELKG